MKRRNFLKGIFALSTATAIPSFLQASQSSDITLPETSGLDRVITIINSDKRLKRRVSQADREEAIECAKQMNRVILEGIIATGIANDKRLSIADVRELNDYIFHNYHDAWVVWHGDDEDGEETGFHKVVNDGARTKLFGKNALNRVFDSIYHLGFETHLKNRLLNEDGNKNASYKRVTQWLNALLRDELESGKLANPSIKEVVGETGTGLDRAIDIIYQDPGLQRRISTGDMREGAKSANIMNKLLIEAIDATDAGSAGYITASEAKAINQYLVENYADIWAQAHGDDEKDREFGFHKVQKDGAKTKLFGKNAINRVFDGIYHLGFKTPYKNRLVNEDGNKNASFKRVAQWLTKLLADDLNNQKDDLKILIPLYSYPNWWDSQNYNWKQLIELKNKYPHAEIIAIINPSNGHFSKSNSDFEHGIKDLHDANIKMVGYVYTSYGDRPVDEVKADIEAWQEFYQDLGINGIFFDEVATNKDKLEHYGQLSSIAKSRGFENIILNPGITTDQSYIDSGIATIVVSYENPHDKLLSNPPSSYNKPSKSTDLSLLIYEMEDNSVNDLIQFAREHKFEYIYFTEDGADGNPWDSISSYLEEEIKKAME